MILALVGHPGGVRPEGGEECRPRPRRQVGPERCEVGDIEHVAPPGPGGQRVVVVRGGRLPVGIGALLQGPVARHRVAGETPGAEEWGAWKELERGGVPARPAPPARDTGAVEAISARLGRADLPGDAVEVDGRDRGHTPRRPLSAARVCPLRHRPRRSAHSAHPSPVSAGRDVQLHPLRRLGCAQGLCRPRPGTAYRRTEAGTQSA